jgi:mono/diheme cytochrome c family protein
MGRPLQATLVAAAVGALLVGGYVGNQLEARHRLQERVTALTGGDPGRGKAAIRKHPCGGCHVIPGIAGAKGTVGPPLTQFARRGYIAGRAANAPETLIGFIEDPHVVDTQSAMPPMGIGEAEARDIAAYLYTLK